MHTFISAVFLFCLFADSSLALPVLNKQDATVSVDNFFLFFYLIHFLCKPNSNITNYCTENISLVTIIYIDLNQMSKININSDLKLHKKWNNGVHGNGK